MQSLNQCSIDIIYWKEYEVKPNLRNALYTHIQTDNQSLICIMLAGIRATVNFNIVVRDFPVTLNPKGSMIVLYY